MIEGHGERRIVKPLDFEVCVSDGVPGCGCCVSSRRCISSRYRA
jgi:hypothetical protein